MYRVIRVSVNYQAVILEDLFDEWRGRPDRFLVFDRDRLLHDIRHRIDCADIGETARVFKQTDKEGIEPYLNGNLLGLGYGEMPGRDFKSVADAWRWLRLKQAEYVDKDIEYYEDRLKNDPGNKFFRSMIAERRATVEHIRRQFS